MSPFMQMNIDFLSVLATLRTEFTVGLFEIINLFGEELIPMVLLCLVYWCIHKDLGYGIGFAFFTSGVIVQGMKIGFRIPRPWDLSTDFTAVAAEQAKLLGSYSFPSGHTQTAAAIFGTLGFASKNRRWLTVCVIMALLVGLSRMLLGVHTPLDVVVSLILTFGLAHLAARLLCGGSSPKTDLIVFGVLMALSLGLLVYALILNGAGTITDAYTTDSLKQAAAALGFGLGAYLERKFIRMDVKTKTLWGQVLKYACGLAGVLLLKEGLKYIIGTSMVADFFRYFLFMLWIVALYPLIIKKLWGGQKCEP